MVPVVHACRADYVTYCNAWNAYKQKRRPCTPVPGRVQRRVSEAIQSALPRRVESTGFNRREGGSQYRGNWTDDIEITM